MTKAAAFVERKYQSLEEIKRRCMCIDGQVERGRAADTVGIWLDSLSPQETRHPSIAELALRDLCP